MMYASQTTFNGETCLQEIKLCEKKILLSTDASRSEQREVVPFLVAEGERNADIYRRMVTLYGDHF